jgi:hypothetical protein
MISPLDEEVMAIMRTFGSDSVRRDEFKTVFQRFPIIFKLNKGPAQSKNFTFAQYYIHT